MNGIWKKAILCGAGALLCGLWIACAVPAADVSEPTPEPTAAAAETPAPVQEVVSVTKTPIETSTSAPATLPPTPSPVPTDTPTPTPEPTPTPGPLAGIVIGIDPGHQLVYNPAQEPVAPRSSKTKEKVAGGCRGVKSRVYEYEVVLNVGLYLRDMLEEAGATVVMTHDVLDVNISNIERAQIFNEANVDLGIRLHCNNSSDPKTKGAFMIVPSEKRTDFFEFNESSAKTILAAYLSETGLSMRYKEGITYRSDQTGFNWCTRPILTIEMGHLTNVEEDALLSTDAFQQVMARGLFKGILAVFTGSTEWTGDDPAVPADSPEPTASDAQGATAEPTQELVETPTDAASDADAVGQPDKRETEPDIA